MVKRRCPSRLVFVFVFALGVSPLSHDEAWAQEPSSIDHIRAITSPFFNESADISTEIRPFYIFNVIPEDFYSDGGYVNLLGVQARYAITDRLAAIFTKAGYSNVDFDDSTLAPDTDGAVNVAFGLKYAILARPELSRFLTVGARYEAPAGDLKSGNVRLEGGGSGMLDMFVSWSSKLGDRWGMQSSAGFDVALDQDKNSSFFHYGMHLERRFGDRFYAVLESNVLTTISNGEQLDSSIPGIGSFEGFDLFNFGSTDSGTVATIAFGGRYRVNDFIAVGAAYELPMTSRKDVIDHRLTFDTIFAF